MELEQYMPIMKIIDMFNRAGICFVTALAMIKFVTALFESGVIDRKQTGGLELKMGDPLSYLGLAKKIASREDIGDVMIKGWHELSARTGVDEGTYENSRGVIKGTSVIPGAENRRLGLMFATLVNPRGGMHLHPPAYYLNLPMEEFTKWCHGIAMRAEDIDRIFTSEDFDCGRFTSHYEQGEAIYWAMGVCVFGIMLGYQNVRRLAELYSYATGIQTTPEELKQAGERIWNLYKMLNVREGFTRADDRLPELWKKSLDKPIKEFVLGELQLTDYFGRQVTQADIERMLDNYYDEHGWDIKTGIPTRRKLAELGLEDIADGAVG
jgi:aldehyde:ferredoxin oxidoreductase